MTTHVTKEIAAVGHAASTDRSRHNITGVYFHPEGKEVVATDGHCLVVRKTDPESINGFKGKIVELPTNFPARSTFNGDLYEETGVAQFDKSKSANVIDGQFPDYPQVLAGVPTDTIEVSLSAKLIAKVAKAMALADKSHRLTFHITVKGDRQACPVKVTCDQSDVYAVIMPMRTK